MSLNTYEDISLTKGFRGKQLTCAKFGHIFQEISYVPFRYIDLFCTSFLWSRQAMVI